MTKPLDQDLVAALARDTVARVAPEELTLFPAASEAYFKNPSRVTKSRGGDDLLGFGGGADVTFLTPVALYVATEVVRFVVEELAKAASKEGAAVIADHVHAVFGRLRPAQPEHQPAASLSEAQLVRVRQLAVERASQLGIPADKAAFLADAVVGTFVAA
jgi:hypothetical protein